MKHQLKTGSGLSKKAWLEKIKAAKNKGTEVGAEPFDQPDPVEPELMYEALWIWNAFIILNGQRSITDSALPLPLSLSDILSYCILASLTENDRLPLVSGLQVMDKVYLDDWADKREIAQKKQKTQAQARKLRGARSG